MLCNAYNIPLYNIGTIFIFHLLLLIRFYETDTIIKHYITLLAHARTNAHTHPVRKYMYTLHRKIIKYCLKRKTAYYSGCVADLNNLRNRRR